MSYLVANLPPVQCFVKKEYLYDFQKGKGDGDDFFYGIEEKEG
jgi:hypothetical protein